MLCIYDLAQKIKQGGEHDIGGTYTGNESDLWFFYSTSICPGQNFLLNIFVCHRKVGNFSIGISNSNELTHTQVPSEISGRSVLPRNLTWNMFRSSQPNEIYHIKTFCFTENDVDVFEANTLLVPITVVMNSSHTINNDVISSIKLQHDFNTLLVKKEKSDFLLVSASGKKFPVHKIILVAHSSKLRTLVKDVDTETFIDIKDSDMELLLQFLYTGTIIDIYKQDSMNLLRIADKFKLQNLFLLTQHILSEQINIENAVEIALLSQKYKFDELRQKVFSYIKSNPKVMATKSWKDLNDVELTKQLIEHIYAGSC